MSDADRTLECRNALASILQRRLNEGDNVTHQWVALKMLFMDYSEVITGNVVSRETLSSALSRAVDPTTFSEEER